MIYEGDELTFIKKDWWTGAITAMNERTGETHLFVKDNWLNRLWMRLGMFGGDCDCE